MKIKSLFVTMLGVSMLSMALICLSTMSPSIVRAACNSEEGDVYDLDITNQTISAEGAILSSPAVVCVGCSVTFSAVVGPAEYDYTNDYTFSSAGQEDVTGSALYGSAVEATYSWPETGTYTVDLLVSDSSHDDTNGTPASYCTNMTSFEVEVVELAGIEADKNPAEDGYKEADETLYMANDYLDLPDERPIKSTEVRATFDPETSSDPGCFAWSPSGPGPPRVNPPTKATSTYYVKDHTNDYKIIASCGSSLEINVAVEGSDIVANYGADEEEEKPYRLFVNENFTQMKLLAGGPHVEKDNNDDCLKGPHAPPEDHLRNQYGEAGDEVGTIKELILQNYDDEDAEFRLRLEGYTNSPPVQIITNDCGVLPFDTWLNVKDFKDAEVSKINIEGLNTSGDFSLVCEIRTQDGWIGEDRILLKVIPLDVDMIAPAVDEAHEVCDGGKIRWNDNDDNTNGVMDWREAPFTNSLGELVADDLYQMVIRKPDNCGQDVDASSVTLEYSSSLKVWGESNKTTLIPTGTVFRIDELPVNLYVEGYAVSSGAKSDELKVEMVLLESDVVCRDSINMTVYDVRLTGPNGFWDNDPDKPQDYAELYEETTQGYYVQRNDNDDSPAGGNLAWDSSDVISNKFNALGQPVDDRIQDISVSALPEGLWRVEKSGSSAKMYVTEKVVNRVDTNSPEVTTYETSEVSSYQLPPPPEPDVYPKRSYEGLYLEGVSGGSSMRDVTLTATLFDDVDESTVSVIAPDIRGDSNHDGAIDDEDDPLEMSVTNQVYVKLGNGVKNLLEMSDIQVQAMDPSYIPEGTLTLQGADNIRIYTADGSNVVKGAAGDNIAPSNLWSMAPCTLKAEGVAGGEGVLQLQYAFGRQDGSTNYFHDELRVAVMNLDLDVDSDNNNGVDPGWTATAAEDVIENDPDKSGKIIGVACGDTDGDGIPDFADGFNLDGDLSKTNDNQSTHHLAPLRLTISGLEEDSLNSAKVRFIYDGAPSVEVDVASNEVDWSCTAVETYSIPASGPKLRLWLKDGATQRNKETIDQEGEDYIAPDVGYAIKDKGVWDEARKEMTVTVYAEALAESVNPGDLIVRAELDAEGDGSYVAAMSDQVRLTALRPDLQLYSRNDLSLMLEDPENEKWEDSEPFAFWVNDNYDGKAWWEVLAGKDCENSKIDGPADLLDMAPFAVNIPKVVKPASLPEGYKYRLRIDNPATNSQNFKIRVFYNKGNVTTNKINRFERRYAYLRGDDAMEKQVEAGEVEFVARGEIKHGTPRTFKPADVENGGQKFFVLEGTEWGKARLYLDLYDEETETIIASDSAMIELPKAPDENSEDGNDESVAGLFGEWNLRLERTWWDRVTSLRNKSSDELPVRNLTLEPVDDWWIRNPFREDLGEDRQLALKQCVFYVHGFNERDSEARVRKQRPIFRRLFWAGIPVHRYQSAHFVAVQWPGDVGRVRFLDGAKYNLDTVQAFYAGKALGEGWQEQKADGGLLNGVKLHVIAHSLGNCVVGEAIQSQAESGGVRVATYSLLESAVTASAYDRGGYSAAVMPSNIVYAQYSGYAPDETADSKWRERWAEPDIKFSPPESTDGWDRDDQSEEWVLLDGKYDNPLTSDNWRTNWADEASELVSLRLGEEGIGSVSNVYAKRWSQECWGGDNNPWRGIFDKVVDVTEVHNFVTHTNYGDEVSDVTRWGPDAKAIDKWYIPDWVVMRKPVWHLAQSNSRPEDGGHGDLVVGLLTRSDNKLDPDGNDPFDEDLPQSHWDTNRIPMEMQTGWTEDDRRECRRLAELAHYFVEIGCPAAVNEIAGLGIEDGDKDKNETLIDLDKLMKHQHSYFVVNEEYWIVHKYVFGKMHSYMKP